MVRLNSKTILACIVALALAPSYAFAADCGDVSTNLVALSNCDFDSDVAGWTLLPGGGDTLTHDVDGDPEAGSAEVTSSTEIAGIESACIPVPAAAQGDPIGGGAYMKGVGVEVGLGCGTTVVQYNGVNCTGDSDASASDGGGGTGTGDTWKFFPAGGSILGDTVSMRVQMGCTHSGPGFTIRIDDSIIDTGDTVPVALQSFSVD